MQLSGSVALITGASSGIGLEVARQLAHAGARVALVARTRANLDAAVAAIGAERAAAFAVDVTDLAALERLPAAVVARFGRLDILVNNAGANHRGEVLTQTPAHLAEIIATNLTAPIVLTRVAVPLLPDGGAVVNVASLAGVIPVAHEATYSASKAGLRAFTRALGEELAGRRIRCSTVCPGPVDTGFFGDIDEVPALVFSQPMSSAAEVAAAVLACIQQGEPEVAVPRLSGALAQVGYLFPALARRLKPLLEKRGASNKARYIAQKRA